jgi:hypothetical protein
MNPEELCVVIAVLGIVILAWVVATFVAPFVLIGISVRVKRMESSLDSCAGELQKLNTLFTSKLARREGAGDHKSAA